MLNTKNAGKFSEFREFCLRHQHSKHHDWKIFTSEKTSAIAILCYLVCGHPILAEKLHSGKASLTAMAKHTNLCRHARGVSCLRDCLSIHTVEINEKGGKKGDCVTVLHY